MRGTLKSAALFTVGLAAQCPCGPARADVTIQQQTTIHAFVVRARGTTTDRVAGDKQRNEREFSCDGVMSMFCGHKKSVDIVRVDRGLTWTVDLKKKRYTETPMPTPEEVRALREHRQAMLDKLKSCPQAKAAPSSVDTSKCEMSPPVIAVNKTHDVSNIIGHSAQRTNVSMTQSCKVKDSGDVCSMTYSFDVWLTQDELPGIKDRMSFDQAYQRKLGESAPFNTDEMAPVLAPYADSLQQLKAKAADFKGYPLKTTFRFAVGGVRCGLVPGSAPQSAGGEGAVSQAGSAAGEAGANSAQNAAGWGSAEAVQRAGGNGLGGYIAGSAAGAFTRNLVGSVFAKKKKSDAPPDAGAAGAAGTAGAPAAGDAGNTVAEITVETTAIDTAPIAADQFEVPEGWKKLAPKPAQEEQVNCPGAS
ncbi:MAG: hypothetical protein QOD56_579 [Gammaproteobacteria bacterium]|jgi:hypothetical protein|nr:hypothetical protein [Gammaproteobacteria bacterium]